MSKTKCAIACFGIAAMLLAHPNRTNGQGRDPQRQEMRGIIKSVDFKAASITVAFGGGRETAPTEKTFALAKDVEVCTGGGGFRFAGLFKQAKLADLGPGTVVGLSLSPDNANVASIVAEEPIVRGVLKSVDGKKNTLTVAAQAGREQAGEEKTYPLAADAEIAVDDGRGRRASIKEGKLDELAEGAIVSLRLSLDKTQVRGVFAEGSTLSGIVKALDPAKRTITLTLRPERGDDAGEDRTLPIAKDAVVMVDDGKGRRLSLKEAKLADVPGGSAVVLRLAVDQSFVMLLRAEGPTLVGILKGLDAENRTVSIAIPKGRADADEKTLPLAKDARITFDGKAIQLADLKISDNGPLVQLRLTLDHKAVQVVTASQPRAR